MVWAGLPASSRAFAIRIWLAIVLALYVSFWLELEAPSTAALTVAILALPTRGQVIEKAVFRIIATVVGITASIAIVGFCTQSGSLLLGAFAAWIGLCVYVVGLLDGNRAYAAALSGYTVALIAVQQIDNPQHIFESSMARGAAITIGILAITLVSDLLAAPDHHGQLAVKLNGLHRRVADYAGRAVSGEIMPATIAAGLLREIVALRPDIASLATESSTGPTRSAAARSAMVGLVAELFAARALATLTASSPVLEQITSLFEGDRGSARAALGVPHPGDPGKDSSDLVAASASWLTGELLRRDREVHKSLDALASGDRPPQAWRAPLFHSHRIAAEAGIRAAVYFLLAADLLAIAGWPAAEVSLSFVGIIIGLGATTPDLRSFTTLALVAAPIASLMAGVLEFLVLDGVTEFPLLAIGLAPFMVGAALLISMQNPVLSGLGRLNLVFILALLAPSNPQTYNPETFLFSVLFLFLATGLLFAVQILIPPVSNDHRRRWLLRSARHDLSRLPCHDKADFTPEERMFRDAGRVALVVAAGDDSPQHRAAIGEAMANFDQAAALRLCDAELRRLADNSIRAQVGSAYRALRERDATSMLTSAHALHQAGRPPQDQATLAASAALVLASVAFDSPPPDVAVFSRERKP